MNLEKRLKIWVFLITGLIILNTAVMVFLISIALDIEERNESIEQNKEDSPYYDQS